MNIIADLHIHGRYSRACSTQLSIKNLEKYARIKGINLLGTGDFTHPEWYKELQQELQEDGTGILRTTEGFAFMLTTEISLIYTQAGRGRRIHLVVWAPSFAVVDQITKELKKYGRVDYDGRPIFKIPCPRFVEMFKAIDDAIEIIPAHIWTPWFSLFGANSGFDSVKECFDNQEKHIFGLETGLSSDPAMNWQLSQLDRYSLVSFSDSHAHWPWRLGREATVFNVNKLTYKAIINALRTKEGLEETIEVDPNFGKYHLTGHRSCKIVLEPEEAFRYKNICPVCRKLLTVGVLQRVNELADRPYGFKPKGAIPFRSLIPLSELIAAALGKAVATKTVWQEYYKLVSKETSEFDILLFFSAEELLKKTSKELVDLISKNRRGEIPIKPGYDGLYGIPQIKEKINTQEKVSEEKERDKNNDPSMRKKSLRSVQTGLNKFYS
ncbi:DNA helicase UvrD [Candidatus Woesearchaeota archaeon]|nr:DNA helicase UvrD [Candidatus Woesearchaeota archaeon]